jgi:RimJ/RimL family protein N-acetyltransferase
VGEGAEIETPRLRLRRWRTEDLRPFAALNADPEVMEHFPSTLSREETVAAVGRIEKHFENLGYGLWAVGRRGARPGAVHWIHRSRRAVI